MAGYLTTHVLDTARGCPARGPENRAVPRSRATRARICKTLVTNDDGRTDEQILPADAIRDRHL